MSIKQKYILFGLVATLAGFLLFAANSSLRTAPILILLLFFISAYLLFIDQKLALYALIISRPLTDILSGEKLFFFKGIEFNINYLFGGLSIIILYLVFLKFLKSEEKIPLKWQWSALLLISMVSILYSMNRLTSLVELTRLLSIFSLFLLAYQNVKTSKDIRNIIIVIVLSALVPSLLAYHQYFTGQGLNLPLEGVFNRIYGTFSHPNPLAHYLVLATSLVLFFLLAGRKNFPAKLGWTGALIMFGMLIVFTYSRGSWAAIIIILFIIGLFRFRKLLPVLLISILLMYWGVESVQKRIDNLFEDPRSSSANWRVEMWRDGWKYSKDNFWTGTGIGTSAELIAYKRNLPNNSPYVHNDYLKIFIELGPLGLAAFLWLIFAVTYDLFKNFRRDTNQNNKTAFLVFFSLAVGIYIWSFADNILQNISLQWAWWAMVGGYYGFKTHRQAQPGRS